MSLIREPLISNFVSGGVLPVAAAMEGNDLIQFFISGSRVLWMTRLRQTRMKTPWRRRRLGEGSILMVEEQ